jgi:hypothetical protein
MKLVELEKRLEKQREIERMCIHTPSTDNSTIFNPLYTLPTITYLHPPSHGANGVVGGSPITASAF